MTETAEHKCPHCPDTFGSQSAVNAHKGQVHDTGTTLECEACGDEFEVLDSRVGVARTCSVRCRSELHREEGTFADDNNPRYKDVNVEEMAEKYEVWGVTGNEEYDARRIEKENWYHDNGYVLVGVNP